MPKELVHWKVAGRVAELLAGGPFGPALSRCPHALRLGACFHDSLYYLRGEHPQGMRSLPHRLHGSHGEDTFALLALQAAHVRARGHDPAPAAFFVGMVSHIFADAAIHPLVFHLTGNYYDPDPLRRTGAIRRHRALESLMDMVVAGGPEGVLGLSLRAEAQGLECPLPQAYPVDALAAMAGCDGWAAARAVAESLDAFCSMQALCRMQGLARLVRELAPLLPGQLREIAGLFYAPQLWEQRAALTGEIAFRNPASGEERRLSLAALMEEAARATAVFCAAQAQAVFEAGILREPGLGPSLDMGLPGVPVSRAAHFAAQLVPAD